MTRRDVLSDAIDKCVRELYSLAQPSITYDDFIEENKVFLRKEKEYYNLPEDKRPPYHEYMGPKPFEFYYLPREVFKDIADSYVEAYGFDDKQNLLDIIETLKNYCQEPIIDKWIERDGDEPGHRGYEHPDNLVKQLTDLIPDSGFDKSAIAESVQNKLFEFLDMAGEFFNWNRFLNTFNTHVYLGGTPNSNKEAVIENWKKYRNKDIKIDEEQIKKEYYGDEEFD